MTTSEKDIVPATSHWSFAKVTVKTAAKKSPSTSGARSATARGRSRATALMRATWYGGGRRRGTRGSTSSSASSPAPRASARDSSALLVRRDPVVEHDPAAAAVPPELRVHVADRDDPLEQLAGLDRGVASAEHEVELLRRARLARR